MSKLTILICALAITTNAAYAERTAPGGPGSTFFSGLSETVGRAFSGRPAGQAIDDGGRSRGGKLLTVNGCSQNALFTTHYGNPGGGRRGRGPACDRGLVMNRHYSEFANKVLPGCIEKSADAAFGAGALPVLAGGDNAIYHAGCMGDESHRKRGRSWHNHGLAWDVNAIKVNGRILKYADVNRDRKVGSFFQHFRKCWAQNVPSADRSCNSRGNRRTPDLPGTIGNEDRKHRHHLHLSLPCRSFANGRGGNFFQAAYPFFEMLFPAAHADDSIFDHVQGEPSDEVDTADQAESKFFTGQLRMPKGLVEVSVEDTQGEPLDTNAVIDVTLACHKSDEIVTLESQLSACKFDGVKANGPQGVVLNYRVAQMVDGMLSCSVPKTKHYSISCL